MKKITNAAKGWTSVKSIMPNGLGSTPCPVQKGMTQYCKRCGRQLLYYWTDEDGKPNESIEEEMALRVCHKCYSLEVAEIQRQLMDAVKAAEPTEEEKLQADERYEKALQKYQEELKKKSHGSNT